MSELPKVYRKLVIEKLSTKIREAVKIVVADLQPPKDDEVCIKNRYVGLNTDDITLASGRYFVEKVPCDIGFEGIGIVVSAGCNVTHLTAGDYAVYITPKYNAYGEYVCVPAIHAFKVPEIRLEYLVLVVSGLTGCIGLDQVGRIKRGETVLITAAAGGVGHIAVQWAKLAGCHVIGTCSTDEKGNILKELGCDRVINYSTEDLAAVLEEEFPDGVDVVWETIGGKVLETCLQHLAVRGRVIIAGGISRYLKADIESDSRIDLPKLTELIIYSSKGVLGYNMENYQEFFSHYMSDLRSKVDCGEIQALYNYGCSDFIGFEGILSGIEHLFCRTSIGKIIVKMS